MFIPKKHGNNRFWPIPKWSANFDRKHGVGQLVHGRHPKMGVTPIQVLFIAISGNFRTLKWRSCDEANIEFYIIYVIYLLGISAQPGLIYGLYGKYLQFRSLNLPVLINGSYESHEYPLNTSLNIPLISQYRVIIWSLTGHWYLSLPSSKKWAFRGRSLAWWSNWPAASSSCCSPERRGCGKAWWIWSPERMLKLNQQKICRD